MGSEMTGRDVTICAVTIPAVLAWLAYGLCWLLAPRMATEQSPIVWAGYAAGGWYLLWAVIFGGPWVLLGL